MKDVQVRLSTLIAVVAIASAGAFAAGRSTIANTPAPAAAAAMGPDTHAQPPPVNAMPEDMDNGQDPELPPDHPPIGSANDLGSGHGDHGALAATEITWKVPARWQQMPNTSTMRIATYRVPRAPGDNADGDVSVMQAGGATDANVERWIGQFGPEAKAGSKITKKKVGDYNVTIVEAEGEYGGMQGGKGEPGQGLLGAIVETPDMPHFFKIVGPKKTVQSARAELDGLLSSIAKR